MTHGPRASRPLIVTSSCNNSMSGRDARGPEDHDPSVAVRRRNLPSEAGEEHEGAAHSC